MSSIGAAAMPRCASTCQSNLMFWPILRTPGASISGFRSASGVRLRGSGPAQGRRRRTDRPGPAAVAERDIAGAARRDGERKADKSGLKSDRARSFRCRTRHGRLERRVDPGAAVRRRWHRLVGRRGRSSPRASLDARLREVCGRRRTGRRSRPSAGRRPAAGAGAGGATASPPRPRQPPAPTKRGSGSIAPASKP